MLLLLTISTRIHFSPLAASSFFLLLSFSYVSLEKHYGEIFASFFAGIHTIMRRCRKCKQTKGTGISLFLFSLAFLCDSGWLNGKLFGTIRHRERVHAGKGHKNLAGLHCSHHNGGEGRAREVRGVRQWGEKGYSVCSVHRWYVREKVVNSIFFYFARFTIQQLYPHRVCAMVPEAEDDTKSIRHGTNFVNENATLLVREWKIFHIE